MSTEQPVVKFEDYFFSGPGGERNHTCGKDFAFKCLSPNACARGKNPRRQYCCDKSSVCWAGSTNCNADGTTRKCGEEGKTQWCCLKDAERCTSNLGQINICWSTEPNLLNKISVEALESTYANLSSQDKNADRYPFEPLSLYSLTASPTGSPTPTPSSSGTQEPVVTNPNDTPSPSPTAATSSGLAPGAIAGIVIGALAGIILGGVLTWWLMKKRRRTTAAEQIVEPPPGYQDKGYYGNPAPQANEMPVAPVVELPAGPASPQQQYQAYQPGQSAPYQISQYTGSSQPSSYQHVSPHSPHNSQSYGTR